MRIMPREITKEFKMNGACKTFVNKRLEIVYISLFTVIDSSASHF
jgi:hypothetical protein